MASTIKIQFLPSFQLRIIADRYVDRIIKDHFTLTSPTAYFSPLFKNYLKYLQQGYLAPGERMWDGKIFYYSASNRLPQGFLQELIKLCKENSIEIIYCNEPEFLQPKNIPVTEDFLEGIKLRDYQIEATNTILKYGIGIIKVATGGGKCVIGDTKIRVRHRVDGFQLEGGEITIRRLYDLWDFFKTRNPEVFTDQGWQKILDVVIINNQELMELELQNGFQLVGAEDHLVMTKEGFKKLKDITEEDEVEVNNYAL